MKKTIVISFFLCALAVGKQEVVPQSGIAKLKQGPCTFLHVWATWCTICIQEMPELIKFLATQKGVRPVILDVSAPFVQEKFSKQWMKNLKPPFTTYLKPDVKEDRYLFEIDKYWSGAMPYSAIYKKGEQKKVWVGQLKLDELKKMIPEVCR